MGRIFGLAPGALVVLPGLPALGMGLVGPGRLVVMVSGVLPGLPEVEVRAVLSGMAAVLVVYNLPDLLVGLEVLPESLWFRVAGMFRVAGGLSSGHRMARIPRYGSGSSNRKGPG